MAASRILLRETSRFGFAFSNEAFGDRPFVFIPNLHVQFRIKLLLFECAQITQTLLPTLFL